MSSLFHPWNPLLCSTPYSAEGCQK